MFAESGCASNRHSSGDSRDGGLDETEFSIQGRMLDGDELIVLCELIMVCYVVKVEDRHADDVRLERARNEVISREGSR